MLKAMDRIIAYSFYALFFFTPLIFNPSRTLPSSELFEWNKMAFVYVVTIMITTAWIGRMIIHKKFIIRRTPFDIPVLLFLFSQGISTLFSIDRHVSLFGYYSRFHGGLLSTISYTFLYFAYVSNRELINLKQLLLYSITSGTLVAGYGIAERFGIDAHMWVQDVKARVFSTLGQPNWLAAYLAIISSFGLGLLISKCKDQNVKSQFKIQNILVFALSLCILIFYLCILFTKSRSGFLGFWGANFLLWSAIFYFSAKSKSHVIPAKAGMTQNESSRLRSNNIVDLFLLLNSSFLILNFFIRTPFFQYNRYATLDVLQKTQIVEETKAPVGDSIINVGITDSAKIREIVWKGAFDIIRNYPLFGTGPETFAYAYYRFRPAEHNLTSEWDFLYNRAHNEFLNTAATSGLIGLTTYLFLICIVFIVGFKNILTINNQQLTIVTIALLAAYLSIHITNFFGFSVVVVGLYFFLIPAFIIHVIRPVDTETANENGEWSSAQVLSLFLLIGASLYLIYSVATFWLSDSLYAQAESYSRQGYFEEARSYIVKAIELRPDEPVFHDERASTDLHLANQKLENREATGTAELLEEAVEESTLALKISPQNVSFWKTRSRIFFTLALLDEAYRKYALESILIASELAPTDPKITYNVGVTYQQSGKNEEAITTFEKAIALKPDYQEPYVALALMYEQQGNISKARETLELILKRIDSNDQEVKKKLEELK